ncbi:MAG: hypothetical protein ACRBFS_20870 [Aureispira sp.]
MNIKKIDKETDNGAFEMAFRDGNWGLNPEQVLPLIKALIKRHNETTEVINKLIIQRVSKRSELLAFLDWHYEDDIADQKTKETIVDTYLSKS